MIHNYLKIAWRNILKNKVFSVINMLGLSLGIAVCVLITLYVKDEFTYDQFQKNKQNIYRLVVDSKTGNDPLEHYGVTGMKHGEEFKKQVPEVKSMVRLAGKRFNIRHNNEVLVQEASQVDSNFFTIFTADFIEGSAYKVLDSPNSIVISETVAKRFFGNEKALGKILAIDVEDEFRNFTITGVIQNSPQNSTIQINLLMPFDYSKKYENFWMNFYLSTFFTFKPNTQLPSIEKKFAAIYANDSKEEFAQAKKEYNFNSLYTFRLQPFLDIHLNRTYQSGGGLNKGGNALFSYFLLGIALFILIIACTNFVNISISHSSQRSKEIGVRKVMGGERRNLIFQFLSESFALNLCAFLLALVWVQLTLPTFNGLINKSLSLSYLFDWKLIGIFGGLFLLTGFLAGFYPALVLSSYQPVDTLYGRFKLKGKNLLQKSLIIFQFGLATFFIIMTLVQYRQVDLFTSKNLGYDDKNLLVINTNSSSKEKGEIFMEELKRNPNIVATAARNEGSWVTGATVNGDQEMGPDMNVVNDTYVATLGLKMKSGRSFSKDFPSDSTQSIFVNEAFVKESNWDEALGKTVKVMNRDPYKVIGVVQDYHFSSLYETVRPQIFTTSPNYGSYGTIFIRLSGKNIPKTLEYIQSKFKEVFPSKPFAYDFQATINEKQYEKEFQMRQIILISASIMIFISCMGLFGLSILTIEKRRKEISIRRVLGANVVNIVRKLTIDFVILIAISFIIFAPLAYLVGDNLLQSYPYRISISADIFIICFTGIFIIACMTISYQAIKAAFENPIKALKTE